MLRQLKHRISPLEAVGLKPVRRGVMQCIQAIVGDKDSPPTKFGLSSLRMFWPLKGPATWLGWSPSRSPILNYFNREAVDQRQGFDVRADHVRDFRGGHHTYNAHNGVDFVIPVGTRIVAPAPGLVVRSENLMNRGGLKIVIDHGDGFMTLYNHLARALVTPGQTVAEGETIALSGFSSVDGIVFFPWVPPHLHFAVFHNGFAVDPFAEHGEVSLWKHHNDPQPIEEQPLGILPQTAWHQSGINAAIANCTLAEIRDEIAMAPDVPSRGRLVAYFYYFAQYAFPTTPEVVRKESKRKPFLSLPIHPQEIRAIRHAA